MTDHVTGDQVKRVTVEEAWADLLECIRTDPYNERGERGDLRSRVEAAVREDERERIAQGFLSARTGYDGEEERTVTPEEFERIRKDLQP